MVPSDEYENYTAEPEVVNEEKKLEVPEFQKKEIEAIILKLLKGNKEAEELVRKAAYNFYDLTPYQESTTPEEGVLTLTLTESELYDMINADYDENKPTVIKIDIGSSIITASDSMTKTSNGYSFYAGMKDEGGVTDTALAIYFPANQEVEDAAAIYVTEL